MPKQYRVVVDGKELYVVRTMNEAARKLTEYYSCPYVTFSRDMVYNIRMGRYNERHKHIQIESAED
jgi:hypothetical protein